MAQTWTHIFRVAPILLVLAACDPKTSATADRISSDAQLIGGPKALGQVGDYLLQNDKIRVIIHGPGPNRGSTIFAGSIIDADLQRPGGANEGGRDQFGELTPFFLFEGLDPLSFEVTSDGTDGGAGIITIEGVGGDMLQMLALVNTGLLFPQGLRFREQYRLDPGKPYVEITTTLINDSDLAHPFPFVSPAELKDAIPIPGLEDLQLSVPLGHLILFGGADDVFAPGVAGFNVRFAVEDVYKTHPGFPAFPGLVTEYLAGMGEGVSYGLVVPPEDSNYVKTYGDIYDQEVTDHSLLVPYLFSAVTGVYHAAPPAVLGPNEEFSFKIYFIVGRGDIASVSDVAFDLQGTPTGTFSGILRDRASGRGAHGVSVVVQNDIGRYITELKTDVRGVFQGKLPAGDYVYRIVSDERAMQDGVAFSIRDGKTTSIREVLESPGELLVEIRDETGRRAPAKVVLVGQFDEADKGRHGKEFLYDLALGQRVRATAFDPARTDFIENIWYSHDGLLHAKARPGTYTLSVSRGIEYHNHTQDVTLTPGKTTEVAVTLERAYATDGYASADLHMHSEKSMDSVMHLSDRVTSIAAEGVEFVASTEHNFIADYAPAIAKLGLQDWLTSTVGLELTTLEMGHFNGYPLRLQPGNVRGGEFNWVGETPDSLFDQLRALGKYGPTETIVQANHPRFWNLGYFNQFGMDSETSEIVPRQGVAGILAPYKPEFDPSNFSLDFDALEVVNGKHINRTHSYVVPDPLPDGELPDPVPTPGEVLRDEFGRVAYPGVMEDWFVFLNRGAKITGVGNSDSHKGLGQEPGYPRTLFWVGEGKDRPGQFSDKDIVRAIQGHRGVATNGPMIFFTVNGEPVGGMATDNDGQVLAKVHVVSPNWAPFERVTIYANGAIALQQDVPAAQQHDFTVEATLSASMDTWFLAEVTGNGNLFPIVSPEEFEPIDATGVLTALTGSLDLSEVDPFGQLKPKRTFFAKPFATTNPIWVDTNNNGAFDAPLAPLPSRAERQAVGVVSTPTPPTLREVFEKIRSLE